MQGAPHVHHHMLRRQPQKTVAGPHRSGGYQQNSWRKETLDN